MSKKFLFTGTISVGKSTTLDYLRRLKLPDVSFVNEVARDLMNTFPDRVIDSAKSGVLPNMGDIIFEEQIRREAEAEKLGAKIILCDRGALDIITHARVFGSAVKKEWEERVGTYDLIFYFRKEGVPFNQDSYPAGINWSQFREALDEQTRLILASSNIEVKELSGSLVQRAGVIKGYLPDSSLNLEGEASSSKERF